MSCRQVLLLYGIVTEARVAEEACSGLCPSGGPSEARRPDPVRVRGKERCSTRASPARAVGEAACWLRREVNNSLIIVNNFHKIQNFRQISDLFSQI